MTSSNILTQELIESGRDIPLKELLLAKRVLENYMAIATEHSPKELLPEMISAVTGLDYFNVENSACEARNLISKMLKDVNQVESFDQFTGFAQKPKTALNELIEDRAILIKHERDLLLSSGYDVSKI